jgi:hypothetical protein
MNHYVMCPCCGRSILVDEKTRGKQLSLWSAERETKALDHGGETWSYRTLGRAPGGKLQHETGAAPDRLVKKVVAELVRRCRAFIDRSDA